VGQLDVAGATVTRVWLRVAVAVLAMASMAHVGSPDTFFTGDAGPYPIRVTVRLPGVIPGLAQIAVRLPGQSPNNIRSVTVQAVQWNVGPDGAPPPDPALSVPGDSELYSADLWFMAATSYRVIVVVDGHAGRGTAIVPVLALATEQRTMTPYLGAILVALGLFLSVGLITIVASAVRESGLPPGATPDAKRRRRSRLAASFTAILIALVLWGGKLWWGLEASIYGSFVLYQPFNSKASVRLESGQRRLILTIDDDRWPMPPGRITRYSALMPDHGKLMHMFLVREASHDVFAHTHPVPRTPAAKEFEEVLPPLPAGRYRVFADIVHESGYAQTLVTSADLPTLSEPSRVLGDPDDSWFAGSATPESAAAVFTQPDGANVTWERGNRGLVEAQEHTLTFVARNADGSPMMLEPYLGMTGHVAIARDDGSVFVHLHPAGSISMAALQKFGGSTHAMHSAPANMNRLAIPYAFPKAGRYRLWVQMKRAGTVFTSAFDADVRGRLN
jgi:hypothetical protein